MVCFLSEAGTPQTVRLRRSNYYRFPLAGERPFLHCPRRGAAFLPYAGGGGCNKTSLKGAKILRIHGIPMRGQNAFFGERPLK